MEKAMNPLPAPGLAIIPQYLSNGPLKIILKSNGTFSSGMTATIADSGTPLFLVDSASFSMSHRQAVIDAASNTTLFEVRKESMSTKRYYAEMGENGPRLFETQTRNKMLGRPRTEVVFANQADEKGGRPEARLEFTPAGMGEDGSFTLNGEMVALVEKVSFRIAGEYHLTLTPGFDPALVVGVMVAMIDRAKSQTRGGIVNGGAATGTGGSC